MDFAKKYFKTILVIAFLCVSVGVFNINVPTTQAATEAELQLLIAQLQAQIADLQKQIAEIRGEPAVWCHDFNRNLKYGNSGTEVRALQRALHEEGFTPLPYKEGDKNYGNFEQYTASAVVQFQEKYASDVLAPWGLKTGTGFVGSTTRQKLNAIYGCGVVPPPVKPYIKVLSPNGGEQWVAEQSYNLTWTSRGIDKVGIEVMEGAHSRGVLAVVDANLGKYSWNIDSSFAFSYGTGESNPKLKIFIYRYQQSDIRDESDNSFTVIEKAIENLPPVVDGLSAPTQLKVEEKGTWIIKAHDPENGQLTYNVNWGDEYKIQPLSSSLKGTQSTSFTHSYSKIGNYTIRFTVTDNQGQTANTSTTIKVVSTTCHTSPLWDWDYCSSGCKCYAGEGDCDTDADCHTGFCAHNVGAKYGQVSSMDVCEEKVVTTCTDSDGGKDYYTQGTVTTCAIGGLIDEQCNTFIDSCANCTGLLPSPVQCFAVKEYYCDGNEVKSEVYTCPYGCSDGACKPGITVTSPNGGETLSEDSEYTIKWDASGLPKDAKVYITLFRTGDANMSIVSNLPATQREYVWKVTTADGWGYPCFGKGTKILMESGTYKNIENISLGEYIVSFDLQKKKFENSKVVEVIQREDSVIIINQKLKIVPDQMIYVNGEFKIAKDVKIGDSLLDEKGETVKVYSVKQNLEKKIETYDFVLEGFQNFFAEGYLVHSAPGLEEFGRVYSVLSSNQSSAISYQIMVSASWGTWGTDYYGSVYDRSDGWFYINPSTCTDTDGGKDYYVKGTTKGLFGGIDTEPLVENPVFLELTDVCDTANNVYLSEYYCDRDGYVRYTYYQCPYGCSDGACKPGITVTSPNGGEEWVVGENHTIQWTSPLNPDLGGSYIALMKSNLSDMVGYITGVVSNNEPVVWDVKTLSYTRSGTGGSFEVNPGIYRVRVLLIDTEGNTATDDSDNYFSIVESEGVGLKSIENQLASLSNIALQIAERLKELMK